MSNKGSGNLIYIKWGSGGMAGLTDKSVSFEADMMETTDQQSTDGWKEYIPGEKSATISFSGLYANNATVGGVSIFNDLTNGTKVTFYIGEKATGRYHWTGSGYIKSLEISGPKNDPMSYSGTIQVTGKPTTGTSAFTV